MYISLNDVGVFILFIAALVISGYLIAVLHRIFCFLGTIKETFADHSTDIGNIISALPETLENVNELTASLRKSAELTTHAFNSLQHNVIDTVDDLRDGLEEFATYAKIIGEIFRAVFGKNG